MCGDVRSILLLPLVARCLETIDVCIWCMFVLCMLLFLPSETYGRNGVTQIFRYFHRTTSSTTGSWSRWNILLRFLYIILSTTVSFLDLTDATLFTKVSSFSFFCVYISFFFFAGTLCMCVMYLTSFDGFF